MRLTRLTILSLGALTISACSSIPFLDDDLSGGGGGAYAGGSTLAPLLSGEDARALDQAFLSAMETGEPQTWRGPRASGVVTPDTYALGNLKANPRETIPAARADLDLDPVLETDLGLYVLTRNSNVRTGPGTGYKVAETLASGSGVDVVGRTDDGSWMLVAADGVVRGYVYRRLMIKAPGTELELAGGPRRQARLCRKFAQRMEARGQRDQWRGAACLEDSAWRLARPQPGEVGGPAILLTD